MRRERWPKADEKIKTFSYNKKDLASGIESNAMCVTGMADYWVGCEVGSDEDYLNCHKLEGEVF